VTDQDFNEYNHGRFRDGDKVALVAHPGLQGMVDIQKGDERYTTRDVAIARGWVPVRWTENLPNPNNTGGWYESERLTIVKPAPSRFRMCPECRELKPKQPDDYLCVDCRQAIQI
jgi:hypothetical protein